MLPVQTILIPFSIMLGWDSPISLIFLVATFFLRIFPVSNPGESHPRFQLSIIWDLIFNFQDFWSKPEMGNRTKLTAPSWTTLTTATWVAPVSRPAQCHTRTTNPSRVSASSGPSRVTWSREARSSSRPRSLKNMKGFTTWRRPLLCRAGNHCTLIFCMAVN